MKWIYRRVAITLALLAGGCGFVAEPEEYRQEGGRTVYRAPGGGDTETDAAAATPGPQKVPGEKR